VLLFSSLHASQCFASTSDIYVFDTSVIKPFLDANIGTLSKLSCVLDTSCSLTLLHICDGLITGIALVERLDCSGAFFHIKHHANLNAKLLSACHAWAQVCNTRVSNDFAHSDAVTTFTMNPKRLFHACMFKAKPLEAKVEAKLEKVETLEVREAKDLLERAADIVVAYEREVNASKKRAEQFMQYLSVFNTAKAGVKRARDDVERAEEQLEKAVAAKRSAEAVLGCAEKELAEVMKGV
jgi:hypothetical protein